MVKEILTSLRGFKDIHDIKEIKYFEEFEKIISNITNQYGICELRTPIVEKTELFERSIGTDTDIVNKEMYTFEDRNGESVSLRPEGTASCVRCALERNLIFDRGIKRQRFWYLGPMFRRERPQQGRFRQFHQFGVEVLGSDEPEVDVEVIELAWNLLKRLGISDIKLKIKYDKYEQYIKHR